MTLRMGDGPVANLPAGLDAYAGYADTGGIGVTYPGVVAKYPDAHHLSISVHGQAPAECGDVESGSLASWKGYTVGYASTSRAGDLIRVDGRPRKLWTAHYTNTPHICTSRICWPSSPTIWEADGTQWTDHAGAWDESLLLDNFFDFQQPPPPAATGDDLMDLITLTGHPTYLSIGGAVAQVIEPQDVNSLLAEGAVLRRLDALTPGLQQAIMAKLAAQAA